MKSDDRIPPLRQDLLIHSTMINDTPHIVLSDEIGFAKEQTAFSEMMLHILQQIDGKKSFNDLHQWVLENINTALTLDSIKEPIEELIKRGFFQTEDFLDYKSNFYNELNKGTVRYPICAGSSYSELKEQLNIEIDEILSTNDKNGIPNNAKAIIAPHIDFKIGKEAHRVYSSAYSAIKNSNPDIVIILGTSHSYSNSFFMMSAKNYLTPLGEAKTNQDVLNYLLEDTPERIAKIDEMAHLKEHSVEFQVVLLQKLFAEKDITFVPVVTGSLHEYLAVHGKPTSDTELMTFITKLQKLETVFEKKVLIIASVDFAHIGRKFGDDFNAEYYLDTVREEDAILLNKLSEGNSGEFLEKISNDRDKWKICGTSPIYLLMQILDNSKGTVLDYGQWHETETSSAVTFSSVAFYNEEQKDV